MNRILSATLQLIIPRGWWRDLRDPNGPGVRFAICHDCELHHLLQAPDIDARFNEFARRHEGHRLSMVKVRNPMQYGEVLKFAPNADVKEAFQGAQTMTVTNLHSLARSATAGWQSDAVTNTSNLYLDDLFQVSIAAVNTAPANGKVFYVFGSHSIDGGTTYTDFGATVPTGTQGTITFSDVTTLPINAPLLGTIAYPTQNKVINSRALSMAESCGYVLPERYLIGIINDSGFTTAASGNTVKHNGVYRTVV